MPVVATITTPEMKKNETHTVDISSRITKEGAIFWPIPSTKEWGVFLLINGRLAKATDHHTKRTVRPGDSVRVKIERYGRPRRELSTRFAYE